MASTELTELQHEAVAGFEAIEQAFPLERRQAIAQFIDVHPEDPAFIPFLAVAAQHGLNPIMGEIWLIQTQGRNADGVKRKRPAAGRDGYLKVARRDPGFQGVQGDVVCAHDEYSIEWTGGENDPVVRHRHAPKPAMWEAGENALDYRGRIIGAWAKCYAAGKRPMFYFAPLKEHGRVKDGAWVGAWSYTSAMILKAAMSLVLRIMYGVTGMAPVDEMEASLEPGSGFDASNEVAKTEVQLGGDDLGGELREMAERVNAAEANSYPPAALQMLVGDGSETERRALLARMAHDAELFERRNREREERAGANGGPQAEPEETVTDAQVVVEDGDTDEVTMLRHELADLDAAFEEDPENEGLRERATEVEAQLEALAAADPVAGQSSLGV